MREGVEDGTLRSVDDPPTVALSIFGAITLTGLSAAVDPPPGSPGDVARDASLAVCDLLLGGLAGSPTRSRNDGD